MTIPAELENVLARDPEIMHGALCFRGTRVPIQVLFDNLEEGMGVDEFVREFPTVSLAQARSVMRFTLGRARDAVGVS